MADPSKPTDAELDALLARILAAAAGLPRQGWVTARWERDGTVSGLIKVGCRSRRGRVPSASELNLEP